ncbi:hypothetical protein BW21_2632 [Burkholderia humptydooensis]|nr:hypothetical protein BW21_2632 [Burkholderia sp. 2002721687]
MKSRDLADNNSRLRIQPKPTGKLPMTSSGFIRRHSLPSQRLLAIALLCALGGCGGDDSGTAASNLATNRTVSAVPGSTPSMHCANACH